MQRLCRCHGEPMQSNGPGNWRCYVKRREYRREADKRYYDSLRFYVSRRKRRLRAQRTFWESKLEETA